MHRSIVSVLLQILQISHPGGKCVLFMHYLDQWSSYLENGVKYMCYNGPAHCKFSRCRKCKPALVNGKNYHLP